MLLVTVYGYRAVFDHNDKQKAAESMLANLITDRDFLPDNRLATEPAELIKRHNPSAYGILLMPGEDLEEEVEADEPCWVSVEDYASGVIIPD